MNFSLIPSYARSLLLKRPLYCLIQVTYRCNFNCIMCNPILHEGEKEKELGIHDLRIVASKLKKLRVSIVNIGGGEPLVRNDIIEILSAFSKDFNLRMQTNGYLPNEELIKEFVRAGLRSVSVSMDTLNPQKFDYLCGSKNAWHRIADNMYYFSKHLPRRGSLLIMNTVVTRENILELPDLVRFANSLGYYAAFIPVHLSDNPNEVNIRDGYAPELGFHQEDSQLIHEAYSEVISMKKEGYRIFNSLGFLKGSPEFLLTKKVPWKCDARMFFLIHPDGGLSPCHPFPAMANILDEDIVPKVQQPQFRRMVKQMGDSCSGCMHPCWAETSQLAHDPLVFGEKAIDILKSTFVSRQPARRGKTNYDR